MKKNMERWSKDFVAIDIETSGLDEARDFVIKVMAVKVKGGEIVERFSSFVFCPEKLSPAVVELTGICDADLEHAPSLDATMGQFALFREGLPLVAYGASFIEKFLRKAGSYTIQNVSKDEIMKLTKGEIL